MIQVNCTIRGYNSSNDTCSVEIQGIGIIDTWIDGVAIAQTVNRGYMAYGAAGVLSMPDAHRLCQAKLIQVVPPGSLTVASTTAQKTYTGHDYISTNNLGNGSVTVTFTSPFSSTPVVSAIADNLAPITISAVSTTQFTVTLNSPGPANGYVYISWTASGNA